MDHNVTAQPDGRAMSAEPPRRLRLAGAPGPEPTHHESWDASLSSHFLKVSTRFYRGDLGLNGNELTMLVTLVSWVRGRGSGSVTLSRPGGIRIPNLAEWTNQSRSQVKRSLQVLEERGFATIVHRTGMPSKYTLHLDHIARQLKLPRGADEADAPTPPVKAKPTANVYAGKCKDCGRKVNVGDGIMHNGLRHVDCSKPHPEARKEPHPDSVIGRARAREGKPLPQR